MSSLDWQRFMHDLLQLQSLTQAFARVAIVCSDFDPSLAAVGRPHPSRMYMTREDRSTFENRPLSLFTQRDFFHSAFFAVALALLSRSLYTSFSKREPEAAVTKYDVSIVAVVTTAHNSAHQLQSHAEHDRNELLYRLPSILHPPHHQAGPQKRFT